MGKQILEYLDGSCGWPTDRTRKPARTKNIPTSIKTTPPS